MIRRLVCAVKGHHLDPNRCWPRFCLRCQRTLWERAADLNDVFSTDD